MDEHEINDDFSEFGEFEDRQNEYKIFIEYFELSEGEEAENKFKQWIKGNHPQIIVLMMKFKLSNKKLEKDEP